MQKWILWFLLIGVGILGFLTFSHFFSEKPSDIALLSFRMPPLERGLLETYKQDQQQATRAFIPGTTPFSNPFVIDSKKNLLFFIRAKAQKSSLWVMDRRGQKSFLADLPLFDADASWASLFSVSEMGVFVPMRQGMLFFDFVHQQLYRVFSGSLVGAQGFVRGSGGDVFVQNKAGSWFLVGHSGAQKLDNALRALSFYGHQLWKLEGSEVWKGDQLLYTFDVLPSFERLWFEGSTLLGQKSDITLWQYDFSDF